MHFFTLILLCGWLLAAVYTDIRRYRIPNVLVLSGAVVAMVLNTIFPPQADTPGLVFALQGLGIGLAVLLPLYLLRVMGAGDVKLMAMIGAFTGPAMMPMLALYVLVAGGVLAIGVSLLRGRLGAVLDNLKLTLLLGIARSPEWQMPLQTASTHSQHRMPYAIAIAIGTFACLLHNTVW